MGIKVRFLNFLNPSVIKFSDIVCVDSRCFNYRCLNKAYESFKQERIILNYIKKLRKKAKTILWFDNTDSAGNCRFFLLELVDGYYKKQLLKNRLNYNNKYYLRNIYFDYYSKKYFHGRKSEEFEHYPLNFDYEYKISLSWNIGLSSYGFKNNLNRFFNGFLKKREVPKFTNANPNRKFLINGNIGIKNYGAGIKPHHFDVINFQRKHILNLLKRKFGNNPRVLIGVVPKRNYIQNLKQSNSVLSPFGWGEICYRDFEAFMNGAALIKPDINHLETWPDVFIENNTYIPISWEIERWDEEISKILLDERKMFKIGQKGQIIYKQFFSERGKKEFCQRFLNLITLEA